MTQFIKLNDEPIEIEFVEDEHDETRDFEPSFWFNNRRYYLEDFIRVHNNPWISSTDDFPENIHGMEHDSYYNPLFIETLGGSTVNVYQERS